MFTHICMSHNYVDVNTIKYSIRKNVIISSFSLFIVNRIIIYNSFYVLNFIISLCIIGI